MCKIQKEPRSPKEIADIYSLKLNIAIRGYRKFMDVINIEELLVNFTSSQLLILLKDLQIN